MKNVDLTVVNFSTGRQSTGIPSVIHFVFAWQQPMSWKKRQYLYYKGQVSKHQMFATQGTTKKQRKMPIETSVKTPEMNPIRAWFTKTFIKVLKASIFSGNADARRDDL
jgi:hypothetical protein